MSRTVPTDFSERGPAKLTPKRLEQINDNYKFYLADSDKADDLLDHEYYMGNVDAYSDVLTMLHEPTDDAEERAKRFSGQEKVMIAAAIGGAIYLARKPIKWFALDLQYAVKERMAGRKPVRSDYPSLKPYVKGEAR